jgi:hypothetical protein
MTDSVDIDEVRPGKLAKMTELAQQYIRENEERYVEGLNLILFGFEASL